MPRASLAPLVVGALALLGLTVRLQHLDQSLLLFHPTRQYRSALIARACYYDRTRVPDWARRTARANRDIQPAGEPPLMEWLACRAYVAVGAERLEAPRAFSAAFWVMGALPLYSIAASITSPAAAIVGVATYLFAPYGIIASRAFQPDALMTALVLVAIWTLARFHSHQTKRWLAAAAIAVAVVTLIKPMSVFLTLPAAVSFAAAHAGLARVSQAPRVWLPIGLGLLVGGAYYGYGAVVGTLARDQMQLRFVPSLLGTPFFWQGLWTQAGRVFGVVLLMAMAVGTLLARGSPRALLVSLWVGYAAFSVAFTYHMPTHDYYHLPYLVLAAVAAATVYEAAIAPRVRRRLASAVVAACFIGAAGTMKALPALTQDEAQRVVQYERIGDLAKHSARVLFLDLHYGYPLMYHGQVSGDAWPTSDDLAAEELGGLPAVDAEERYRRDFADYGATHFIATDLASLAAQPDLQRLLSRIGVVVQQTSTYHVYRLMQTE